MINIYYQNVRGLRTKSHLFYKSLLHTDYDVVCLTETWLLPGIYDEELFDSRYVVYRRDRNCDLVDKRLGGGVLIAVRKELRTHLETEFILDLSYRGIEIMSVSVMIRDGQLESHLKVYCGYFPHSINQIESQKIVFEAISDLQLQNRSNTYYLLVGDYNISHASWMGSKDNPNVMCLTNPGENLLIRNLSAFMSLTDLTQYNTIFNINNRLLDLVLASCTCIVARCDSPLVPEDDHHPALCIQAELHTNVTHLNPPPREVLLFFSADYDKINSDLLNIDWWNKLFMLDTNAAVDAFYEIIHNVIKNEVPTRRVNNNEAYPPWFSRNLKKIINKKLKVHKRWKIYNRLADYELFSSLRSEQKLLERECYNDFIKKAEDNIKTNPKNFWSYLKSKKTGNDMPNNFYLDSIKSSVGQDTANLFNHYFHSVFEPEFTNFQNSTSTLNKNSLISINTINIDTKIVKKYLDSIDISKGSGPDGIHPVFIKRCSEALCIPLSILFRKSLESGEFPCAWKRSHVVPIFKAGDKHNIKNYRGISKLTIMAKIFEKIVYDTLFPAVRNAVSKSQHGFISKKSTETNLCEFVDMVTDSMDKGYQVDAVYTDYSKAFDKISHNLLVRKLESVGVHGDLLRWLDSYLRNRSQAVTVKGFTSSYVPVTSGVPQGSHLGPLLFNIFINDIISQISYSKILLYADDMKMCKVIESPSDCTELQKDLNVLSSYCQANNLHLNLDKCYTISFSRKRSNKTVLYPYKLSGAQIKRVTGVRDLGVTIDNSLDFKLHYDKICHKAFKMLGFVLRQGKVFKKVETLVLLYNTFVRSQLEYASSVWSPYYRVHIDAIESIQNRFIKYVRHRFDDSFCLCSLELRRKHRDQFLLYKIVNNMLDSPYLLNKIDFRCSIKTRCTDLFHVSPCRANYARNSFVRRTLRQYNKFLMDIDMFNDTFVEYCKAVRAIMVKVD